ncbi:Na+/H+ antiporter subunit E [Persicirhabdus sediminis]|uniref:Na+/H+ antiporter subunit E n=1 Tax=Persicirhabdus sediminis TaxID=454144 RepID=A0A8J7MB04_9BACT|nr:Na+/H+ antiporter subunit E [Persicirhabdus sediminis]MBK1789604.1 Na+/H+ antiporter subunit E [Persicirhabdus sediminis]
MSMITKPISVARFAVLYLKEILIGCLRIARLSLAPKVHFLRSIEYIDIQLENDVQRLALGNLISMTPGTLTMDYSDDGQQVIVHMMYADEEIRQETIDTIVKEFQPVVKILF